MFQTQQNSPHVRRIVCLALMASVGFYIALAYFMSSSRTAPADGYKPLQMPISIACGIILRVLLI
jgi:hypothetical protein